MSIPKYFEFMKPLLGLLSDNKEYSRKETDEYRQGGSRHWNRNYVSYWIRNSERVRVEFLLR